MKGCGSFHYLSLGCSLAQAKEHCCKPLLKNSPNRSDYATRSPHHSLQCTQATSPLWRDDRCLQSTIHCCDPRFQQKSKVVYKIHSDQAHKMFKKRQEENHLVCLSGDYQKGVTLSTTLVLLVSTLVSSVPRSMFLMLKPSAKMLGSIPQQRHLVHSAKSEQRSTSTIPNARTSIFVYDLFNKGIDTMVLYKQWMKACTHNMKSFINFNMVFRAFCKAQVVDLISKGKSDRVLPMTEIR